MWATKVKVDAKKLSGCIDKAASSGQQKLLDNSLIEE